ncbi:glycosyl transferase [Enterococcus sp. JM4C]|uniref:glycosyltransferase family 8 protein n=1 Tax=Candidatus Enterococcus huntleyi TaxID=1857217 RepID=UPI00137AF745|nr:glycosyltransferase family 8 protein [Enterococcus sp. JM4C]KAF1295211.1 glycosyl transferase [Enterococcus sp. JM4C]
MKEKIDLLFTLNEGYLQPLKVALLSIHHNNPHQTFRVWLIHESIPEQELGALSSFLIDLGHELQPVTVDGSIWTNAPTVARYPKEMYFRLLAGEILPTHLTKVLYLDPDILVINSLTELWETPIDDAMFAAARHTGLLDVSTPLNKVRLDLEHGYYNSGVLLMNLTMMREKVRWEDISATIEKYDAQLFLPDQDILNYLYGKYTVEVPEERWNYDARMYTSYLARSLRKHDIHWVMEHTSILHFCGRPKPWDPRNDTRFTALYLSYSNLLNQ